MRKLTIVSFRAKYEGNIIYGGYSQVTQDIGIIHWSDNDKCSRDYMVNNDTVEYYIGEWRSDGNYEYKKLFDF